MEMPLTIVEYVTEEGKSPFAQWLDKLKDKQAKRAVLLRLTRIQTGNLGDFKSVGDQVEELRIHQGPGYRLYFYRDGDTIIVLLCAGDKSSQQSDIDKAALYLQDYQRRKP